MNASLREVPKRSQQFFCASKKNVAMDASGFEPEAPRLQSGCSTELSYAPGFVMSVKIKKSTTLEKII